ncbi:6-bladed beta-propeller [Halosquirtibacter xylanolyticus]|uniref:6-bladed beta-propeller n=1 Tax=Halosquirtibacter xylanolyticus TaxID=3374599 RepID=UPI0037493B5E|nr:6-bladed beta-propeller [Prolixibacteraceae bacterium]
MISKENRGFIYGARILNSILLIGLLFLLITSCNKKMKSEHEFEYVINVSESLSSEKETVKLSDYCSQINYIPLETHPECLLRNILKLEMTKRYIYVSDGRHVYMFDKQGQFIREISKIGKGPEEHGKSIRFTLDQRNNEILICDIRSYPARVLIMNALNGSYKRTILINEQVDKVDFLSDGRLMFFTMDLSNRTSRFTTNEILLTDHNGNILDSIQDNNRLLNHNNILGTIDKHSLNGSVYYMGNYKNKMYKVMDKFMKVPYVLFDYQNKVEYNDLYISPEKGEEFKDHIIIRRPVEDPNNLFFITQFGVMPPHLTKENFIFSKRTHQLIHTEKLINDVDGGMPFWPSFYTDNKLIMTSKARDIITYREKNSGETLNKIAKDLKMDSNPVLVIAQ